MTMETIQFGGRQVRGFALGADAPPAQSAIVAAVLAYRSAWDAYVMGVLRGLSTVGDAFTAVSANPPSGFTTDQLQKLGAAYSSEAQSFLAAWNQFAGLTPDKIENESGVILQGWQDTITKISKLAADEKVDQFAAGVKWPDPPPQDVQSKVLADLKAVAVDPSFLGILGLTGSRALQKVDGGLSGVTSVLNWVAAHKTALIVGGSVVGGVVVLGALSPYVKLLAAAVPSRH